MCLNLNTILFLHSGEGDGQTVVVQEEVATTLPSGQIITTQPVAQHEVTVSGGSPTQCTSHPQRPRLHLDLLGFVIKHFV